MIWLGITVENMNENPHETKNPFVFSDGSDSDDSDYMFKWEKDGGEPDYDNKNNKCSVIFYDAGSDKMASKSCGDSKDTYGLCKIYEGPCERESEGENSESERSRANLPIFALFMACSVFKSFCALVGIGF